jgi:hypothetical protein
LKARIPEQKNSRDEFRDANLPECELGNPGIEFSRALELVLQNNGKK